jgi:ribosomal protein S18 acetylase RimI-like enzyme
VLGVLEAFADETLVVRRDNGESVEVTRSQIVAAKPVPPRTPARPRIAPEALQLVCAAGWQAPVREQLGDWLLRAGGGFTGRTDSVLPVGDPGMPLDAALEAVSDFYARVGLPVQAQVVVGAEITDELLARGWVAARPTQADALVQVAAMPHEAADLAEGGASRGARAKVRLTQRPGESWLQRYGRAAGTDPATVRSILESGDLVTFAQIGEPAVAVGRAVLTGRWLGLSAVEVDPGLRRQGLGSAVAETLLSWGGTQGARSAYLQVLADNRAALGLYARYGFRTHHSYRYLRPPA